MHHRGDALQPFGWNPRVEALAADGPDEPGIMVGRVVRVDYDRVSVVVAAPDGSADAVTARAADLPAVGDWVWVAPPDAEGGDRRVAGVLPRWSTLERTANDGTVQTLAADVDVVLVVAGLDRDPNWNRLDRELVIAWDSGAQAVVVLNKADLIPDATAVVARAAERLPGVEVVVASAVSGEGIDRIVELAAPDRTIAFLGASGVGKSSLVNALVGRDVADIGDVRAADRRGRHTTTARHLIPLPAGGVLLDTPGVRSLGLGEAHEGLATAFSDIADLGSACRFRDCAHDTEPGCAVVAAVERGEVPRDRYESWQKLQAEMDWQEARDDPAEVAARRREARRMSRAVRRLDHEHPKR